MNLKKKKKKKVKHIYLFGEWSYVTKLLSSLLYRHLSKMYKIVFFP